MYLILSYLVALAGSIICFVPLMLRYSKIGSAQTVISSSIHSQYVIFGHSMSLAASLFAAVEELIGMYIFSQNRDYSRKLVWLLFMGSVIFPNCSYFIIYFTDGEVNILLCILEYQNIWLIFSCGLILHDVGRPVFGQQTLLLSTLLFVSGYLLKCFSTFGANHHPHWISTAILAIAIGLFYYNIWSWFRYLHERKSAVNDANNLICSSLIVTLFIYSIIKILNASNLIFNHQFSYGTTDMCICVYSNAGLLLLFVALRNQITKANLEKIQVICR